MAYKNQPCQQYVLPNVQQVQRLVKASHWSFLLGFSSNDGMAHKK
jgi:hypothetical protein